MQEMHSVIRVAVGSRNPVKVEAVRQAFERVWPEQAWEVQGVEVPSGVSNQPMRDEESIQGARNRASGAISALDVFLRRAYPGHKPHPPHLW